MRIITYSIGIIIALAGTAIVSASVDAATLFLQPEQETLTVGQRFVVELHLSSEKETINAVAATLRYDRELLRPISIVQDSSFLTLWPELPAIHEDAETITLIGGVPGGSVVIDGRVVAIEFEALKAGTAWIGADETTSQVLIHDGQGTSAKLTAVPGTYLISAVSPFDLTVTCATHPLEDVWYAARTLRCDWEARLDAVYTHTLSLIVSDLPGDLPAVVQDGAEYADIADGAYYFILSEKLSGEEWRVVARRRVQVDATAPLAFTPILSAEVIPPFGPEGLRASNGGERVVIFSTTDATSGIARYELIYGSTTIADATSPYRLPDSVRRGTITVRAYDRAGNVTEGVLTITRSEESRQPLALFAVASALALTAGFLIVRRIKQR